MHDRPRNHISVTYITRILCPPLSAQAALDWKGPEHRYYTDIADFIRQASDKPQEDLDELWCRIVFTILVSNTDDHLKNHGFLYAGRSRWRLSPAFDINPAPMRQRMLQTGIMEGSSFEVSLTLALEAAPRFGLEPRNAKRTVARMAKVVHENWRKDFRAAGASSHETQAFVPAFEHRAMELALSLQ
ncbi:MAG: HipA domain-containing protein [Gammaproteobacteria bacterium]|nr:HipA domain-containing protein [Gammaproteobacteria bacterium]